jgi:hypothetical protein
VEGVIFSAVDLNALQAAKIVCGELRVGISDGGLGGLLEHFLARQRSAAGIGPGEAHIQQLIKRCGIRFGSGFDERAFSCQSALLEILLALRGLGGFLQGYRGGQQARQARHRCAGRRERSEHHDVLEPAVHGSSIGAGASMIVVPL